MGLPEIDLKEELIDESPTDTTTDKGDATAPPDGGSGSGQYRPDAHAEDGAESARRTSRALGKSFADIAAGRSRGEHPALDAIIGRQPERYAETICTPDCPNRRRDPEHDESAHAASSPLRLISDVKPSTRERLYHIEREVERHDRDFETIRQICLNGATVRDLQSVDERIDHVHTRIDRDVLPPIADLKKKRLVKDVLVTTGLVISIIGNIIALYKLFIIHP